MVFLISLIVAVLFSVLLAKVIRKCPGVFYVLSAVICIVLSVVDFPNAPHWLSAYVLDLFRRGALGTALFVVVMYIGTLKNGSKPMKLLMPIRGYLSIIASILCLCHNVFYGRTYFVKMFTGPLSMPLNQLIAGILTIIMLIIMVPLFIMSFRKIRNKMKPKQWKFWQRFAYGYYGLLYVHIMVLMVPFAMRGMTKYLLSILVYSVVFAVYLVMRLQKAKLRYSVKLPVQVIGCIAAAAVIVVSCVGYVQAVNEEEEDEVYMPKVTTGESAEVEYVPYMHDGTFTGSGTGYNGKVEVSIVVKDGKITEVVLGDNKEDGPYLSSAVALFDDVIEQQTHSVDSVSGATTTSVGLKSAIKKAIAASMEPTDADGQTGEVSVSTTGYKDGTFSGTGAGYGGKVEVIVEIKDGKIADIRMGENKEDRPYLEKAITMFDKMKEDQTYDVDTVSGATVTSDALKTGVRRALKESMK